VLVAVLGFVAPAIGDLILSSPARRAFGWAAADTFYYLTVARNVVDFGRFAYDQVHSNNGFHPLWQLVCVALAWTLDGSPEKGWLLVGAICVGIALIAASIPLFAGGLAPVGRRLSVLFPLLPVGAYAWMILPIWARGTPSMGLQNSVEGPMPLYGTLWSYANGMESALVIFFFALSGWIFVRWDISRNPSHAVALGSALAMLVLSRLDHILLAFPLFAAIAIHVVATRGWSRLIALLVISFSTPIGVYLLINHHYYAVLVPSSGTLKASFPHIDNDNLDELWKFWKEPWEGLFLIRAYRQLGVEVPALAALAYLAAVLEVRVSSGACVVRLRRWATRYDAFLACVAPGVVLLALYNLLFVDWFFQGHWYFPVSVLFVSLAALSVAAPLEQAAWARIAPLLERRMERAMPAITAAWLLVCLVSVANVFTRFHRQTGYHQRFAEFYFTEAPKVRAHYGAEMPGFL
jgi:hypothetical protein